MQCPYCKEDNPPGRAKCGFCGEPISQAHMGQKPVSHTPTSQAPGNQTHTAGEFTNYVPDYLVQAILITLFCCLPFGIVAIVFAARVKAFSISGQIAMAQEASDKAKMWCWVGFGIWCALMVIYFFMLLAVAGIGSY